MNETRNVSIFDKHAPTFETVMFQHDYFIKLKAAFVLNFLKKYSISNTIIADFGCGTGEVISILSPYVKYCYGIDSSTKMIEFVKSKAINNAFFFYGDCCDSGLTDNSVEIVICISLLHHVDGFSEKVHILKEMMRIVKHNRYVLIFEHNPWNPITRVIFDREPIDHDARLISPLYMKKLCVSSGYTNFFIRYLAFFPKMLKNLARIEPVLSWLPFGGQYVIIASKQGEF